MIKSRWIAFSLMASFATFFVGGMHLRFRPLTLVLTWFAGVLAIAWFWTRWSERRARERWLVELEDPNGVIFTEGGRTALVDALDSWEDARLSERKLFDELLQRRRDRFLEAAKEAVETVGRDPASPIPSTFLTRILEAYRDDEAFTRSFLELLEGEYRSEVWRLVAGAAEEALEGNGDAVRQVAQAWSALPPSVPARMDFGVAATLERWAETAGLQIATEASTH